MTDMTCRLSVRLFTDTKCFGPGLYELLCGVERTGSLRASAIEMQLAYSKAFRMVKESEQALNIKLLNSVSGGRGGGGAALTADARELMARYCAFTVELEETAQELFKKHFS